MKKLWFITTLALLAATPVLSQDPRAGAWPEDNVIFEWIGQVKNSPPAGPGLPATSVQYGYLPFIQGLSHDQTFAAGGPQNETTALFTFYNDSVTLRAVTHGKWLIVTREGTTTIYYDDSPDGDLTTPNPDSFRDGIPIQTSVWRHQVIFEPTPTGHFFVTFVNTITSSTPVVVGGEAIRLGKSDDQFRVSLVGGPDPAGLVNGKFAGTAVAIGSRNMSERTNESDRLQFPRER